MQVSGKDGAGGRGWWLLTGLATLIALYGFRTAFVGGPTYPEPLRASLDARPWAIALHAGFGGLALLLGPLQFHRGIRGRRRLHRAIGTGYVAAAALTGMAGLALAPYAYAGTGVGFGMLALSLLVSTAIA